MVSLPCKAAIFTPAATDCVKARDASRLLFDLDACQLGVRVSWYRGQAALAAKPKGGDNTMKLINETDKQKLPPLYANEHLGLDAMAVIKFWHPETKWAWYASEGSAEGRDFIFFGLVIGNEAELGYFSLNELEQYISGHWPTLRDAYFKPRTLRSLMESYKQTGEADM